MRLPLEKGRAKKQSAIRSALVFSKIKKEIGRCTSTILSSGF